MFAWNENFSLKSGEDGRSRQENEKKRISRDNLAIGDFFAEILM
jgi:hypothetical protein